MNQSDNKADILQKLKQQMTNDYLPDIVGGSTYDPITGTIYTRNSNMQNIPDVLLALDYFKKSEVILSRQVNDNNALQKALYCKIAVNAIQRMIKEEQR